MRQFRRPTGAARMRSPGPSILRSALLSCWGSSAVLLSAFSCLPLRVRGIGAAAESLLLLRKGSSISSICGRLLTTTGVEERLKP